MKTKDVAKKIGSLPTRERGLKLKLMKMAALVVGRSLRGSVD